MSLFLHNGHGNARMVAFACQGEKDSVIKSTTEFPASIAEDPVEHTTCNALAAIFLFSFPHIPIFPFL